VRHEFDRNPEFTQELFDFIFWKGKSPGPEVAICILIRQYGKRSPESLSDPFGRFLGRQARPVARSRLRAARLRARNHPDGVIIPLPRHDGLFIFHRFHLIGECSRRISASTTILPINWSGGTDLNRSTGCDPAELHSYSHLPINWLQRLDSNQRKKVYEAFLNPILTAIKFSEWRNVALIHPAKSLPNKDSIFNHTGRDSDAACHGKNGVLQVIIPPFKEPSHFTLPMPQRNKKFLPLKKIPALPFLTT